MYKKWIFYSCLLVIIGFLSSGFKSFKSENKDLFLVNQNEDFDYMFPSLEQKNYTVSTIPFAGKFFTGFKEAVGFKESQGHYNKINSLGYMGKYQFGIETLRIIGIRDSSSFMNNPKLQEKAFVALLKRNKWELRDEIEEYSGRLISGVRITESGILAAAHLGGAGSVKLFLKTNGRRKCTDEYGSSVKTYMKEFAGYQTQTIIADSNAQVK